MLALKMLTLNDAPFNSHAIANAEQITGRQNIVFISYYDQKCNFPLTQSVRVGLSVGRLVARSVLISLKGGKLHMHAPIRALLYNSKPYSTLF